MTTPLHFSISINAPKETVWKTMLEHGTYEEWTATFQPGSTYEGSWEKGAAIKFVDASGGGISSVVVEHRPYEYLSTNHLTMLLDGKPVGEPWKDAYENYTFTEQDGVTTVNVELTGMEDSEMKDMMSDLWPKALAKLKQLCEGL